MLAVPVPHGGGGGIGLLIRLLIRLAIWHALSRFLTQYTHVPWLGTMVILVVVFVLARFAFRWYRNRRP